MKNDAFRPYQTDFHSNNELYEFSASKQKKNRYATHLSV